MLKKFDSLVASTAFLPGVPKYINHNQSIGVQGLIFVVF